MTKEEAIALYEEGLEEHLSTEGIFRDKELRDLIKILCVDAFEMGFNVCNESTNIEC